MTSPKSAPGVQGHFYPRMLLAGAVCHLSHVCSTFWTRPQPQQSREIRQQVINQCWRTARHHSSRVCTGGRRRRTNSLTKRSHLKLREAFTSYPKSTLFAAEKWEIGINPFIAWSCGSPGTATVPPCAVRVPGAASAFWRYGESKLNHCKSS